MDTLVNKFLFVFIFFSDNIYAHDTTHIHPLITLEIAKLIKSVENINGDNYYSDLYELNPEKISGVADAVNFLYWGTDFDPSKFPIDGSDEAKIEYLLADNLESYNRYNNVIDGVVQEDVPFIKVLDHFYHAPTGIGLRMGGFTYGNPSSKRAMAFFNESIDWMSGYTEEAKRAAFFTFGQALHHVEDMSSPAHIHNDPHLTILPNWVEPEKDDYEGYYLPQQKRNNGVNLGSYFINNDTPKPINNPWKDIWGSGPEEVNSMVNYFHTRTTYNATLEFPTSITVPVPAGLAGTILNIKPVMVVGNASSPMSLPEGELAKMFPCVSDLDPNVRDISVESCLHWEEDELFEPAHWVINAVGQFQHQYRNGAKNKWWSVESEKDHVDVSQVQNPFQTNKYYLEQIIKDNDDSLPLGTAVVPKNIRAVFNKPWSQQNNDVIPNLNSTSIPEIYSNHLLSAAVEFGKGFTEYWYDVANTPPYLSSVKVFQKTNSSMGKKIKYLAYWVEEDESSSMTYTPSLIEKVRPTSRVKSREVNTESLLLDAKEDVEIILTFNEPMKDVTKLQIGKYNANNTCIEPNSACVDITPVRQNGVLPTNVTLSDNDRTWSIEVSKNNLISLSGKLTITVKAVDKNKHHNGDVNSHDKDWGSELDETPETPARRNTQAAKDTITKSVPTNYYPWYKNENNNSTAEDIAYSYDFDNGDQNHTLIFDTSYPDVLIDVKNILN